MFPNFSYLFLGQKLVNAPCVTQHFEIQYLLPYNEDFLMSIVEIKIAACRI